MGDYRRLVGYIAIGVAVGLRGGVGAAQQRPAPASKRSSAMVPAAGDNQPGAATHLPQLRSGAVGALDDFEPLLETDDLSATAPAGSAQRLQREAHIAQSLSNAGLTNYAIRVLRAVVQESRTHGLPEAETYEAQLRRLTRQAQELGIKVPPPVTSVPGDRATALLLLPVDCARAGESSEHNSLNSSGKSTQAAISQTEFEVTAPGAGVIWVIGQVRQPGRFNISASTTLGKVLYHAGGVDEAEADGDVCIIESLTISDRTSQPADRDQSSTATQVNLYARTRQILQLPIHGGELVIVRPRRETLVYLAVMPHWVVGLQPSARPLSVAGTVAALEHGWPQLDRSHARLLRREGSAQMLLVPGRDIRWDAELRPGDVLCFDGNGLETDATPEAFQSLRMLTGCSVKKLSIPPTQTVSASGRRARM